MQITDNSLARDLFSGDYNCLGDNENRPVKWMAVEALVNKCFSPASDVVGAWKWGWRVLDVVVVVVVSKCFPQPASHMVGAWKGKKGGRSV